MVKHAKLINGAVRDVGFGTKYQVGDVIEQWWVEGEGGNSTVLYTAYFPTRDEAKAALRASNFAMYHGGEPALGNPHGERIYHPSALCGERQTVVSVDQFGQVITYSGERLPWTRIVDGQLTDRAGVNLVD